MNSPEECKGCPVIDLLGACAVGKKVYIKDDLGRKDSGYRQMVTINECTGREGDQVKMILTGNDPAIVEDGDLNTTMFKTYRPRQIRGFVGVVRS